MDLDTASGAGHLWYLVALIAIGGCGLAAAAGLPRWALRAMGVAFLATALAVSTLLRALWRVDLSLAYVADTTSRATPGAYRLSALWGSMEGSLLFWSALQLVVSMAAVAHMRRRVPELATPVAAVGAAIVGSYLVVSRLWADPFETLSLPPAEGFGLVAVLQHPAMIYHPPLLYLGLVLQAVPFAITMAALRTDLPHRVWARLVRPWLYAGWIALTIGMLTGSHWAYVELGWGGFWAWDPVENTSLLPWLLVTASLHGLMAADNATARRWPQALVMGAFVVSVSGVYLTRSGGTGSIHAFAQNETIGRALLALTALWLVVAVRALRRAPRPTTPRAEPRRRTTVLGGQAVILVAATAVVAAGSFFPVLRDLFGGRATIVQPAFYVTFLAPLAAVTALAAVVSPSLLAHRRTSVAVYGAAAAAGLAGAVGLVGWAAEQRPRGEVTLLLVATIALVVGVAEATNHVARGGSLRTIGLRLTHIGFALLLVGAAGSALGTSSQRTVDVGASTTVAERQFTLTRLDTGDNGRFEFVSARFEVVDGGTTRVMAPEIRAYEDQRLPTSEAALRSTVSGDLMISMRRVSPNLDGVTVDIFVRPLISWVWVGALVMVAGVALVAASRAASARAAPDASPRRSATAARQPAGTTSEG